MGEFSSLDRRKLGGSGKEGGLLLLRLAKRKEKEKDCGGGREKRKKKGQTRPGSPSPNSKKGALAPFFHRRKRR